MPQDAERLLTEAQGGRFNLPALEKWLKQRKAHATASDESGHTLLHYAALADHADAVALLLEYGANPHQPNLRLLHGAGETPLNLAAPCSPKSGRLMTLHWFAQACQGKGPGFNQPSGHHQTSLIQYAAKWCTASEIERMIHTKGWNGESVNLFIQNGSGWTPLHAACAMPGRDSVVSLLVSQYREMPGYLFKRTTETYTANYSFGSATIDVTYPEGSTAKETGQCRLTQDTRLTPEQRLSITRSLQFIMEAA